jgi:hypothetical protein
MKILEAVYTSASENLNGAQGYGFVRCSRCLPVHIKEAAKEFPYSTDAGGQAIYSLKVFGGGESWLLMNCTHPSLDYTRRPSYISHSLAFRLDELMDFLDSSTTKQVKISSVFEFMTKFKWDSSWSNSETPQWIEESADLEASSLEAFHYTDLDESKFPIGPLLAFDYAEDDSPIKPKLAAWQFENLTPKEMLATFHSAWLCLDPWRGTRKYADLLGEPQLTLRDSWKCSFTTDPKDRETDAYQWTVLSATRPDIPNREKITPSSWEELSPEEVKEKLGPHFGDLLVERCEGPESWAQHGLKEKLKPLQEICEEGVKNASWVLREEWEKIIQCVKDETRKAAETWNEGVNPYCQDLQGEEDISEWTNRLAAINEQAQRKLREEWEKIIQCVKDETRKAAETWNEGVNPYCQDLQGEEDISEWTNRLAAINEQAQRKLRENHYSYQQSAAPLLRLINDQDLAADSGCHDLNFNDIQKYFNELVDEYQNWRPRALMSESLQALQRNEAKLLLDKQNLEAELISERRNFEDNLRLKREEVEAELALAKYTHDADLASEKRKLEGKLRSRKEEMDAQLRDLTAKKEKITEGKRYLEMEVEKLKRSLRRERLVVLVLFIICIVCASVCLFYNNEKQRPREHLSKTEDSPESGKTQSGNDSDKANSGEDEKKPEHTQEPEKE